MDDKKKPARPEYPANDEIRRDRKFDFSEALGRENADLLKGASPVARGRQAILEIQHFLEDRLADPDGSLLRTIMARLTDNPPLLARHFSNPLGALAEFLEKTLAEGRLLSDLVRDTDTRWGREYQERPRFEQNESTPGPDDPYTVAEVRTLLKDLWTDLCPPGGTDNPLD